MRLWPDPVFLEETAPGEWYDAGTFEASCSLAPLQEARDALAERLRYAFPESVERICRNDGPLPALDGMPHDLRYLLQLVRRIRQREAYLRVIPAQVLRVVTPFSGCHFALLQRISQHPEIMELLETNPLMGFMVATHRLWRAGPAGPSELKTVLGHRRRHILEWLGFDAPTEAMVGVVSRVVHRACTEPVIRKLREALRQPGTVRRLGFLTRINAGVVDIAADADLLGMVTNKFLACVGNSKHEDGEANTASRLASFAKLERDYGPPGQKRVFTKPAELYAALEDYDPWDLLDALEAANVPFPEPPLPDTAAIRAIRTPEEALNEGDSQDNCAGVLLCALAGGRAFMYRVLAPERATLLICKSRGRWVIDEIEAAENEPVSPETSAAVEEWLRLQNGGASVQCDGDSKKCGKISKTTD